MSTPGSRSGADAPKPEHGVLVRHLPQQTAVRGLLKRHGRKLWWLHTSYALGIGTFVAMFAQKGFAWGRWLIVSLGVAWLLIVLFFRFFGSGEREQRFATAETKARLRFLVMTYVLKNLYQGMLFFLLPFYWKSATVDSANIGFVVLIGVCAALSTIDLVFDNVLMRSKLIASIFYAVALFGCLNLVLPAVVPNLRTIATLMAASSVTVFAFWAVHIPFRSVTSIKNLVLLGSCMLAGAAASYFSRRAVPPVPMYVSEGAVGSHVLPDGRLAMEVKSLNASAIQHLIAVTDVVTPGGKGDRLQHVWRHEGRTVHRSSEDTSWVWGPSGTVRLRSSLTGQDLPTRLAGHWAVDVETQDAQLVGRVSFTVTE